MGEDTFEEICQALRSNIEVLKQQVVNLTEHEEFDSDSLMLEGANIPKVQHHNMKANLTLVFRHLEDARMRVGKVLQAKQGGISILDK